MSNPKQESARQQRARSAEVWMYDIRMFRYLTRVLASGISEGSLLGAALLESFLIHMRLLIEFLYDEKKNKTDDIRAADFVDAATWGEVRGPQPLLLKCARKDADKFLAHLTHTRLDKNLTHLAHTRSDTDKGKEEEWAFLEIAESLNPVLDMFLRKLSPDVKAPGLGQMKNEASNGPTDIFRRSRASTTVDDVEPFTSRMWL